MSNVFLKKSNENEQILLSNILLNFTENDNLQVYNDHLLSLDYSPHHDSGSIEIAIKNVY